MRFDWYNGVGLQVMSESQRNMSGQQEEIPDVTFNAPSGKADHYQASFIHTIIAFH